MRSLRRLQAEHLIAVDIDPQRLALLHAYAEVRRPRGAYRTVLDLCGRTDDDFADRCRSLAATLKADCLSGGPLPFTPASTGLITQFGLLGLTTSPAQFTTCWTQAHTPLAAGGWCAGANWNSTIPGQSRVQLTERLYAQAFAATGITPSLITCVPITGDAGFDSVWIYLLGRKT